MFLSFHYIQHSIHHFGLIPVQQIYCFIFLKENMIVLLEEKTAFYASLRSLLRTSRENTVFSKLTCHYLEQNIHVQFSVKEYFHLCAFCLISEKNK